MESNLSFNPHNGSEELRLIASTVSELRTLEKIQAIIKDENKCYFTGLHLDTLTIRVK